MHVLYTRGLWSYAVIAAHSSKPTYLAGVRMLNVRGGRSRGSRLAHGLGVQRDDPPDVQAHKLGRVQRRLLGEGDRSLNSWPKQLRFLASRRSGGGDYSGRWLAHERTEICLDVSGLRCGSCVSKLERALLSVDGALEASVNLATNQARVLVAVGTSGGESSTRGLSLSQDIRKVAESAGFPSVVLWQKRNGGDTKVVLDVHGLKCGGCVSKGEEALMTVEGVQEASINLTTSTATVIIAGNAGVAGKDLTQGELVAALSSQGFSSKVLRVDTDKDPEHLGPTGKFERVTPAERYEKEVAESRQRVRSSLLILCLSAAAHLGHHAHHLLPGVVSLEDGIGWVFQLFPRGWVDWLQAGVATAALVGPGSSLTRSGMAGIRRLSPDMDSLVSVGVLAVYGSSVAALLKPSLGLTAAFHEPVMLLGAVLLGRSLEARQRLKAARGLQGLFDVRPDQARLVDSAGRVTEVSAASIVVGDTVEVLPTDRFPVDGQIISGVTAVDESSLTGEAAPIPKAPGDSVRAGTSSVGDGAAVRVRATATGADSVLSSIIALVEDAQTRKTPVQRLADKVAGKLTWLVFAAAASTLLFWGALSPLLLAGSLLNEFPALAEALAGAPAVAAASESAGSMWVLGLRLAVDVCLVACPCSLGLATPTAVMVGTGVAAEHGLLLTSADVLDTSRKVTTVVFDKTGTLTTGKPSITGVISLNQEWTTDRILEIAAAVERGCRHPLADAVVVEAEARLPERTPLDPGSVSTVPGMGARAEVKVNGPAGKLTEVHVGSPKYIKQACPQSSISDHIAQRLIFRDDDAEIGLEHGGNTLSHEVSHRLARGETPVAVAVEGALVGLLFAADTVRPAAAKAIADLAKRGLKVVVASGDRKEAVWAAVATVGVPRDDTNWGMTPADKTSLVRSLKARGEIVMMVGDGVNDAPALAAADVGVAMRGGTGLAIDAAGVILMRDDVETVGQAIDVSRLTMRKVRSNLIWAFGYNIIAIPLAAGVFLPGWGLMLSPALAGAIMSCSSVAVVTNSLLLKNALERELAWMAR